MMLRGEEKTFKFILKDDDVDKKISLAKVYYEQKKFEYAFQLIDSALKIQPFNQRILIWQRLTLINLFPKDYGLFDIFQIIEPDLNLDEAPVDLIKYPKQDFNGDKELKEIRTKFNNCSNVILRVAANFIGVTLCSANRYFCKMPYHKFEELKAETYHRSAHNPFASLVFSSIYYNKNSKISGTNAAHLGLFLHPLEALSQHLEINTKIEADKFAVVETTPGDASLYNGLLDYRIKICRHIATEYQSSNYLKAGFYHNYPCVMVYVKDKATFKHLSGKFIKEPPSPSAIEAWVNVLISFFIALVNFNAQKNNLSIELTRRSSFGFLTPTIAVCGRSFRINVGIIPKIYADIIIECLKTLSTLLERIDNSVKESVPKCLSLIDSFFVYDQNYSVYKGEQCELPGNLFELIYFKAEKRGQTAVQNLARTALARDTLMLRFFNKLRNCNVDLKGLHVELLLILYQGFLEISLQKPDKKNYKLSYKLAEPVVPKAFTINDAQIEDVDFWNIIKLLEPIKDLDSKDNSITAKKIGKISKNINYLILQKKLVDKRYIGESQKIEGDQVVPDPLSLTCNLFYDLAMAGELIFAGALGSTEKSLEDGYGSDSDIEVEADKTKVAVYGKKIIVQNGMRAIIGALLASKEILGLKEPKLCINNLYYETEDTLKLLNSFIPEQCLAKADIIAFDANPCIADILIESDLPTIAKLPNKENFVVIIDTTSATTADFQKYLKEFRESQNILAVFFVSSGLKNEQMGIDKNPYGTIRVFTKNKKWLNEIIQFIKNKEVPITSSVAHAFRRKMKNLGHVPTNTEICKP